MTQFKSVLETVPATLPAYEQLIAKQKLVMEAGWRWSSPEAVVEKTREEMEEAAAAIAGGSRAEMVDELADLIYMSTLLCHYVDIDPQEAVQSAIRKLSRRFGHIERKAHETGRTIKDVPGPEMRAWYNELKLKEKQEAQESAA